MEAAILGLGFNSHNRLSESRIADLRGRAH